MSKAVSRIPSSTLASLLPRALNPHVTVVDLVTAHLTAAVDSDPEDEAAKPINLAGLLPYLGHEELTAVVLRAGHSHPLPTLRFLIALPPPLQPSPPHLAFLAHSLATTRFFSHALDALSHLLRLHPSHDALPTLLLSSQTAPHPSLPGLLVKALLRHARLRDAFRAAHRAAAAGAPPDTVAFNALLAALSRAGRFDELWAARAVMARAEVRPNTHTFNILVTALCRGEDAERAQGFLEELEEQGFEPDVVTYNTLLSGYCRRGKLQDALHLFGVMPPRGVEPDLVSHTVLMDGLCKAGRLNDARRMFDRMVHSGVSPDAIAYSVLIAGYCNEQRVREARLLLMEMVGSGLSSEGFALRAVIESHVKVGKLLTCLNLVSPLRKYGVVIPLESYNCLIGALCEDMRPHAARGLFKWMVEDGHSPSLEMYNMILDCLCQCDSVDDALDVKVEMSSREVRPDFHTYQALVTCLCRLGKSLDGKSVMAEMIESGLQPNEAICTALVCGFCKEGYLDRAELILKAFVLDFQLHCNESYNALMRAYCMTRSTSESLELQNRMLDLGFVPSSETCRSLIYGLSRSIA
ncbi:pentatricopeptide repeat-containing protein At5g40400 [Brachypodium distachyon]|uniref:pentatricopeptide repeat-containing protein At5g40400 n=1 Tax=Brachypodium distachyon TaxID=15368 RepID=UPI0001C72914|nr:pentatricopeptide repeat-containing protein At5g40400 [Brachypodium distachyon]|eukprot:XP_003566760.1 pentatricopeptide repeat-containing protein At5g40400 [Brachypodium distachyon]